MLCWVLSPHVTAATWRDVELVRSRRNTIVSMEKTESWDVLDEAGDNVASVQRCELFSNARKLDSVQHVPERSLAGRVAEELVARQTAKLERQSSWDLEQPCRSAALGVVVECEQVPSPQLASVVDDGAPAESWCLCAPSSPAWQPLQTTEELAKMKADDDFLLTVDWDAETEKAKQLVAQRQSHRVDIEAHRLLSSPGTSQELPQLVPEEGGMCEQARKRSRTSLLQDFDKQSTQ